MLSGIVLAFLSLPAADPAVFDRPAGFPAEGPFIEEVLGPVHLEERDGAVWIEEIHAYLGMFGASPSRAAYRLGPDLARSLAPLVVRSRADDPGPFPSWWGVPCTDDPIVRLRIEGKVRRAGARGNGRQEIREVVTARILEAEVLPPGMVRAWVALDGALRETVEESRGSPGPEKRGRLESALGRGSAALEDLGRARETPELREAIARLAPEARIVRRYSRSIAREWGGRLREYARALRIEPVPPLGPPVPAPPGVLDLLLAAGTAEAFVAEVRARCGEEGLEDLSVWAPDRRRAIAAWEFEGMSAGEFAARKEEARKTAEDRDRFEEKRARREPEPASWEAPGLGVLLRRADRDRCARDLVIRGTVVEAVLPGGSPAGLRPEDLIVEYERVYDLVMGGTEFFGARRKIDGIAASGGKLLVIREGWASTVTVPGKDAR